jgi:hypothetical protein
MSISNSVDKDRQMYPPHCSLYTCLNSNKDYICISMNLDTSDPKAELKLFNIFLLGLEMSFGKLRLS